MALIKTKLLHERGMQRQTSFGIVTFDQDGVAEVEQSVAQQLCKVSPSLIMLDQHKQPINKQPQSPSGDQIVTGPIETAPTPTVNSVVNEPSTGDPQQDDLQDDPQIQSVVTQEGDDEISLIRQSLEQKTMSEIRQILVEANVDENEYNQEQFKGKDGKPALIEFVIDKLHS